MLRAHTFISGDPEAAELESRALRLLIQSLCDDIHVKEARQGRVYRVCQLLSVSALMREQCV